jgi:hypothetical protein
MAQQFDTTLRNAWLDLIESSAGTAAVLQFRSGTQPANCGAADSGTLIAELTLPSDWMNAASGGSKTKLGTWSVAAASPGTIGHYRLKNSGKTTTYTQGACSGTGGGGDCEVDNPTVTAGQTITVTAWTWTAPGA